MKNFIFTLSTIFFIFSCNSGKNTDTGIPVIDLAEGLKLTTPNMKSLNEISSGYEVIPLETSDECLLMTGSISHVSDNSIWMVDYILSGTKLVMYRFDKTNGSMLLKLDRQGEGPEEWRMSGSHAVDNKEHLIYVYDGPRNKIIKYDFDGVYLGTIDVYVYIGRFTLFDENHFLVSYGTADSSFCAGIYDKQWNLVRQCLPRTANQDKANANRSFYGDAVYQIDDKHYIKKVLNDTLYQIGDQGEKPYLIASKGNFTMPADIAFDNSRQQEKSKYIAWEGGFIASDYYFSSYYYQNKLYQDIWDLKTTSLIYRKITQQQDGRYVGAGYPFKIKDKTILVSLRAVSDGKLYCMVPAEQMQGIIPGIKDDDNPAIIAIKIH